MLSRDIPGILHDVLKYVSSDNCFKQDGKSMQLPLWAHSAHSADIAPRGLLQVAAFPSRSYEKDTKPPHAPTS